MLDRTSASVDSLGRPMQRRIDMRFGTWNIRRVHRTDSLKTVASELAKYKINLMAIKKEVA